MPLSALNFRLNSITYSLPIEENTSSTLGIYGSLVQKGSNLLYKALLAPYKDTAKTIVYSNGMRRYYYSANYPSIHCRKNNTNYSCCNNYQDYKTSTWTFDYAYSGKYLKTVSYAENSFLGSRYNKYTYQIQAAPYGMITPTRSGYTFKGWNTSADDTGDAYKTPVRSRRTDSDATFYALWARIDAGTYGDQQFLDLLEDWFGGLPEKNAVSSVKYSNHYVKLTIGSTAVTVSVGTTLQLSHPTSNFGFDQQWNLVINGTAYTIRWANWAGQGGGPGTIDVSNGWLTDIYTPDIAKGTYSPSSFKNLISQYISVGGSRTVAQGFTATVNGTSVTVPAGGTIYYMHPYSNPDTYLVGFGTKDNYNLYDVAQHSFSTDKTYCVYSSGGILSAYSNFSINISSDIKFN